MIATDGYCNLCGNYTSIYKINVHLSHRLIKDELHVCVSCVKLEIIEQYSNPVKEEENTLKWSKQKKEINQVWLAPNPYQKALLLLKFLHENQNKTNSLCNIREAIKNSKYHQLLKMAKKLEDAGLIVKGKDNRNVYYRITTNIKNLSEVFKHVKEKKASKHVQNGIINLLSKNARYFTMKEISDITGEKKNSALL
jgi:DNA-binding HxlR family transcriptional regulator